MEHHPEDDEKQIAMNERKDPATSRLVPSAGRLASTLLPTSPIRMMRRMNVMIQEYFSKV